jgi:hypothetical protein
MLRYGPIQTLLKIGPHSGHPALIGRDDRPYREAGCGGILGGYQSTGAADRSGSQVIIGQEPSEGL